MSGRRRRLRRGGKSQQNTTQPKPKKSQLRATAKDKPIINDIKSFILTPQGGEQWKTTLNKLSHIDVSFYLPEIKSRLNTALFLILHVQKVSIRAQQLTLLNMLEDILAKNSNPHIVFTTSVGKTTFFHQLIFLFRGFKQHGITEFNEKFSHIFSLAINDKNFKAGEILQERNNKYSIFKFVMLRITLLPLTIALFKEFISKVSGPTFYDALSSLECFILLSPESNLFSSFILALLERAKSLNVLNKLAQASISEETLLIRLCHFTPHNEKEKKELDGCLELLLEAGADINHRNNVGMTPALALLQRNKTSNVVTKILLHDKLNIDYQLQNYGHTLATICAKAGEDNLLKLLVEKRNCNLRLGHPAEQNGLRQDNFFTPLALLVEENRLAMVKFLVEAGHCKQELVKDFARIFALQKTPEMENYLMQYKAYNADYFELVHIISEDSHLDVFEQQLNKANLPDIDLVRPEFQHRRLLFVAINFRHIDIVKFLLKKGASPKTLTQDIYSFPPLFMAIQVKNAEIATLLLEKDKTEVNTLFKSYYPIQYAMVIKANEILTVLLKMGAKHESRAGTNLASLIEIGIIADNFKGVEIYINFIKDRNLLTDIINSPDPAGRTCLHTAVRQGNEKFVELLLRNGANPLATDSNSITPFTCAIVRKRFSHTKHFLALWKQPCSPHLSAIATEDFSTPKEFFDICKKFILSEAEIHPIFSTTNPDNQTNLFYAIFTNNTETIKYLFENTPLHPNIYLKSNHTWIFLPNLVTSLQNKEMIVLFTQYGANFRTNPKTKDLEAVRNLTNKNSAIKIEEKIKAPLQLTIFSTLKEQPLSGRKALLQQGYTPEQINAWKKKNADKERSPSYTKHPEKDKLPESISWFDEALTYKCGSEENVIIQVEGEKIQFLYFDEEVLRNDNCSDEVIEKFKNQVNNATKIKPLKEIKKEVTLYVGDKSYPAKIKFKLNTKNSEDRLALARVQSDCKRFTLLITVYHLPKSFHTNEGKKSFYAKSSKIQLSLPKAIEKQDSTNNSPSSMAKR